MRHPTRTLLALTSAVLLLAAGLTAQKTESAQALLRAAADTALVDGDLKRAIAQYQAVVDTFKTDRAVVATALLAMAEAYRTLGDAEARTIYERIVRDFSDRKEEAALARMRLNGTAAVPSAKGDRAVWTGPRVHGAYHVSPDGRFITGVDQNGSLFVHDVGANVDRVLTPPFPNWSQWADGSAISRDGKQVAYVWWDQNNRMGLRIAALQGSGFPETRQLFLANADVKLFRSLDWSPDGKWIAVPVVRNDGTGQIALIAVADGSFRVLKSIDWNVNVPSRTFFSIDSRYIAYDLPAGDGTAQRDVFVLAIDGSRDVPAVVHEAHETVMGWSPDGTRLLFSSDRTGSAGLWALSFSDGKAQGAPELLKSDIGSVVSALGLTASGTLYVHKRVSSRDIAIAPIDLEAGKLLGPPVSFTQGFVEGPKNPTWSPDGQYLAYPVLGCNNGCNIAIRSVSTGQVRLLPRTLSEVDSAHLDWSPDGRSFLTKAIDLRGRTGIFQIDTQSGEAMAVVLGDGLAGFTQWSPDGKKVYFTRRGGLVERDLASGVERDVNREFTGGLSPDRRYFASRSNAYENRTSLLLVPVAGGQPREILRLTPPEVFGNHSEWTPDSSAKILMRNTGSHRELWLVPVMGGRPRKLDIDPNIWMAGSARPGEPTGDQGFVLSPDGRRIAFLTGKDAAEVWALENFLPAPNAKR